MNESTVRRGILLMNLGSPDSTEIPVVKRYLDEFLMDKKVMDYSYLFRTVLVKGMITPGRSPKTAESYKKIWWPEGSPLIVLTERLRHALQEKVTEPVEMAMRYGRPHPKVAFDKLMERAPDLNEVILIPLYPHYAMSSFETAVEYARKIHKKEKYPFKLTIIRPFYEEPGYIRVLAERIKPYLHEDFDYLLFSYHGLPVRHILKGDMTGNHCLKNAQCCHEKSLAHQFCYRHQVITMAELTAKELGLSPDQFGFSFQSRLGREEWIKPYTDIVLQELPKKGIKKLVVLCPAFVSDCLETLEEMGLQGKETFLQAGGESYKLVPCLNTHPQWVALLADWIKEYEQGDQRMVYECKFQTPKNK